MSINPYSVFETQFTEIMEEIKSKQFQDEKCWFLEMKSPIDPPPLYYMERNYQLRCKVEEQENQIHTLLKINLEKQKELFDAKQKIAQQIMDIQSRCKQRRNLVIKRTR
jgi:hypothetical protein